MAKRKQIPSLRCPTCRKIVLRTDPEFPFCSDRCRVIDLGKWASGDYVISTPVNDPDDLDAIGYQGAKSDSGERAHPGRQDKER